MAVRPVSSVEGALKKACRLDVVAFKPGNVSLWSPGHGMAADDFLRSASAAVPPLCEPAAGCGARMRAAIRATHEQVGCNTNLGIVLLLGPLAVAAEDTSRALRTTLDSVLDGLTVEDTRACFEAIQVARPAGLGRAEASDVTDEPTAGLRATMALAASRDSIARQYDEAYRDLFDHCVPWLRHYRARWRSLAWAATACYLQILLRWPDSHVARKYGPKVAEETRALARDVATALKACENPRLLLGELKRLDLALKARGINPGTSADLTVASIAILLLLERA